MLARGTKNLFSNYVSSALSGYRSDIETTLISIFCLAFGMAFSISLLAIVSFENSFDKMWENSNRIATISSVLNLPGSDPVRFATAPFALSNKIQQNSPQVDTAVNFVPPQPRVFLEGGIQKKLNVAFTEPEFFKLFSADIISGDLSPLASRNDVIALSETAAQTAFGTTNIIGRLIDFGPNSPPHEIIAIFSDYPENSQLSVPSVASLRSRLFQSATEFAATEVSWNSLFPYCFVLLKPGANKDGFLEQISMFVPKNELIESITGKPYTQLKLTSLQDWRFQEAGQFAMRDHGSRLQVYVIMLISLLLIVIATVNFSSINFSLVAKKQVETAIRQAFGAGPRDIFLQYTVYVTILILASLSVAVVFCVPLMSLTKSWTGYDVDLRYILTPTALLIILAGVIMLSVISSLVPTSQLIRHSASENLSGKYSPLGRSRVGRFLVTLQFLTSLFLMISAFSVYSQIRSIETFDAGYHAEYLVTLSLSSDKIDPATIDTLKEELNGSSGVINAVLASAVPGREDQSFSQLVRAYPDGSSRTYYEVPVDPDFFGVLNMSLVAGELPSREWPARTVVISQAILEVFGWESNVEALGNTISLPVLNQSENAENTESNIDSAPFRVIGVVSDIYLNGRTGNADPFVFRAFEGSGSRPTELIIRVNPNDAPTAIANIDAKWAALQPQAVNPRVSVQQLTFDELEPERRLGRVFAVGSIVAVVISVFGLYALANIVIRKRRKEIAIRRVHGASSFRIQLLLLSFFVEPILLASIGAWSLAWWFQSRWTAEFVLDVSFPFGAFLLPIIATILIAILTVITQVFIAARQLPANSLGHKA